jgi:hypothetical protein
MVNCCADFEFAESRKTNSHINLFEVISAVIVEKSKKINIPSSSVSLALAPASSHHPDEGFSQRAEEKKNTNFSPEHPRKFPSSLHVFFRVRAKHFSILHQSHTHDD